MGDMSDQDPQAHIKTNAAKINELNDTIRFTMWSVFKLEQPLGADEVVALEALVGRPADRACDEDLLAARGHAVGIAARPGPAQGLENAHAAKSNPPSLPSRNFTHKIIL